MLSINEMNNIYNNSKKEFEYLLTTNSQKQELFIQLIDTLKINNNFVIYKDNCFDLDEISNIFRFYENLLQESFHTDKEKFQLEFQCYLLTINTFTKLCKLFIKDLENRQYIDSFFQILKESKNILKFSLPLDTKHLNILNNLIGEQLYYFSHINEHEIQEHSLDYFFEKYTYDLEKIFHGYDLSKASNFGDNIFSKEEFEFEILKNNASFLMLRVMFKLERNKTFIPNNSKLKSLVDYYFEYLQKPLVENETKLDIYKKQFLEDFYLSGKYLKVQNNYDIFEEKLELLKLNTDEYKQLIDIILKFDL